MNKFLTFDQYGSDFEKVAIFNSSGWVAMSYGHGKDEFKRWLKSGEQKIFTYVKDSGDYLSKVSTMDIPVLIFEWSDKREFVNDVVKSRLSSTAIYNDPRGVLIGKERILGRMIGDAVDFIPKTVFDIKEARDLHFPIIAKSRNSYDSKGVEKVERPNELDKFEKYDIFQEMIDIDKEYRVMTFRGHRFDPSIRILMILEKMPKNDKAKSLRVDEQLSKEELKDKGNTKFRWKQLNIDKFEHIKALEKIVPYVMNINPTLSVTGMDLAIDKEDKMWFIEHNLLPALMSNQGVLIYKNVFEDFYGRNVQEKTRKQMMRLSKEYFDKTARKFPFELEDDETIGNIDGVKLFV